MVVSRHGIHPPLGCGKSLVDNVTVVRAWTRGPELNMVRQGAWGKVGISLGLL